MTEQQETERSEQRPVPNRRERRRARYRPRRKPEPDWTEPTWAINESRKAKVEYV